MKYSLAKDKPGKTYGPYQLSVTKKQSESYYSSLGSKNFNSLPPLIYVTLALTKLINETGIISKDLETIHAGQEVTWEKPMKSGESIVAQGTLKSNNIRKDIRFAKIVVIYTKGSVQIGTSTTSIIIKEKND
ncbi:MAG: hypothetical protein FI685_01930 [SAR202 cluster bacterium]|jgi:hypothetical protein|nr:hypothetical protein [Dehalococcoidia bacterium]MQG46838.1 hypothetical protein [SAR202 cluster bacterium]|tara:strand:+ start:544 stop:939 length:396 start_codon:yes stop_codon:yes gene_type:complete